ncbi:MAG: tetratricopeptide repeat protein [Anaerolineae bacterium]
MKHCLDERCGMVRFWGYGSARLLLGGLVVSSLIGASLSGCAKGETLAPLPVVDLSPLAPKAQTQVAVAQAALAQATAESAVPLAARFGELGRQYQAYQLLGAAERAYRNALALTPDAFEWRYLLAHTLHEGNQNEAAAESFDIAAELRPREGVVLFWSGQSWAAAGKPEEAKKRYEALLKDEPDHAAAMIALSRILQQEGDLPRTIELLEKARALDPNASEINYPLGMAYRALGQEEKAQPLVAARGDTKVKLVDPIYVDVKALAEGAAVVLQEGTQAFEKGDLAAAEKAFRQAIAEDPANVTAHENLGVALTRLDRLEEAETEIQKAIALEPNRVSLHFSLGSVYSRMGKGQQAIDSLRRAVQLDPAHAGAHFNLANALVRGGQPDDALAAYERVVELQPNNADARLLVGLMQIQAGRWAEAERIVVASATAVPDHPRLVEMLARLRAACPEDARRDGPAAMALAKGLMDSKSDINSAVTQAMALAEVGRFAEAEALQAEALRVALAENRPDLEPSLTYFLDLYKAGKPARELWAPDDPLMPGVQ